MDRRQLIGNMAAVFAGVPSAALATSGPVAGRQDIRTFRSVPEMVSSPLLPGDLCLCPRGRFAILPANSFPANNRTVIDLASGSGQAVLDAGEMLLDMDEFLTDSRPSAWFSEAPVIQTRKESFAFQIAQAGTDEQVLSNANGARFRILNRALVEFTAFGGGPDRSGEENATALARAMQALGKTGGRLMFGAGAHRFVPARYPVTDANVWLLGAGFRATKFVPAVHDAGTRAWMMDFGDDERTSYLGFSGIDVVSPTAPERATFHGIRIRATNQLILRDCHGRFVDGTAWQIERSFNGKIDLRTYKCGSSEQGLHSVLLSGTTGTYADAEGAVFNDVVLVGMTEQDPLGWKIENGLVIRPESSIKVHGGADCTRSLHLHRISNGAMSVYPTLGFNSDNFIMISDAGAAERQAIAVATAPKATRFNLNVVSNHNIRYFGRGKAALIAVDCAVQGSRVIISGDILRNVPRDGDFRYVHLIGPGHAQAEIDLSDLKFQDEDSSKWVLDERTESARTMSRRATGVFLPAVTGFVGSDAARRLVGQTDHIRADGDSADERVPAMSLIGLTTANEDNGTLLYMAMQPIIASVEVAVGARTLIASQRLNIPLHAGKAAAAILRRVTVGATGVPERHDPENYWRVRLYSGRSPAELALRRDETSQVDSDGLPSKVLEGWSPDSFGFDFHSGLGEFLVLRNQTFSIRLEPVGEPARIEEVSVAAYFETRV